MKINITFFIQILSFIFYIYFCIKYIWPYIDKVLEKRKRKLYIELKKIKYFKLKIKKLKKKIKYKKILNKKIFIKINNDIKNYKIYLFKKYKKKAKYEYIRIINNAKLKIILKKKNMYSNFNKNISNIVYIILKKATYNIFNKKLDNKFINKILNKNKLC